MRNSVSKIIHLINEISYGLIDVQLKDKYLRPRKPIASNFHEPILFGNCLRRRNRR